MNRTTWWATDSNGNRQNGWATEAKAARQAAACGGRTEREDHDDGWEPTTTSR